MYLGNMGIVIGRLVSYWKLWYLRNLSNSETYRKTGVTNSLFFYSGKINQQKYQLE